MFINLSNEFVFGSKILDIYSYINKNDKNNEDIIKKILDNEKEFCQRINEINNNKKIVGDKFEEQIKNIDDNVFEKINKVFDDNILRIKNDLEKFIKENNTEKNKEKLTNIIKLFN